MERKRYLWTGVLSCFGLFVLILDAKTALSGAQSGISLCINSVIPSLFPFFIVTSFVRSVFIGKPIRILRPISRLCGIPEGAESLMLLGFLGGYPVGAQGIHDAYCYGAISKNDAKRMLGFCNNAGPAFLFGMLGCLFSSQKTIWIIWGIHIVTAIIIGMVLPGKQAYTCKLPKQETISIPSCIEKSIKSMGLVCAWVVVFRVIITFLERWIFWLFPTEWNSLISGILELTNGCHALAEITKEGTRFVFSATFLGVGGLCVAMQTVSVTKKTGTGMYFLGKLLHGALGFLTSILIQHFIFPKEEIFEIFPVVQILVAGMVGIMLLSPLFVKKPLAFLNKLMYNNKKRFKTRV